MKFIRKGDELYVCAGITAGARTLRQVSYSPSAAALDIIVFLRTWAAKQEGKRTESKAMMYVLVDE
jgi:hypothetical protein